MGCLLVVQFNLTGKASPDELEREELEALRRWAMLRSDRLGK